MLETVATEPGTWTAWGLNSQNSINGLDHSRDYQSCAC